MYLLIPRFRPIPSKATEVADLLDDYLKWLRGLPGFIVGIRLSPVLNRQEVALLTAWEAPGYAEAAATTEHALGVRSQLLGLTRDHGAHTEEFEGRLVTPAIKAAELMGGVLNPGTERRPLPPFSFHVTKWVRGLTSRHR